MKLLYYCVIFYVIIIVVYFDLYLLNNIFSLNYYGFTTPHISYFEGEVIELHNIFNKIFILKNIYSSLWNLDYNFNFLFPSLNVLMSMTIIIPGPKPTPLEPVKTFKCLDDRLKVLSYASPIHGLRGKSGIYSFINLVNGKQYIGSAKDLYRRLKDHLEPKTTKSNIGLQQAFTKYGRDKFEFVIYEFVTYDIVTILERERSYFIRFDPKMLYNITMTSQDQLDKIKARLQNSKLPNLPTRGFLGRKHSLETRRKMSQPGAANPMFGKNHAPETKEILSLLKSTPTYLYNILTKEVLTFKNNVEVSIFFNCYKGTVGDYIIKGKLYISKKGQFYISKTPKFNNIDNNSINEDNK